MAELALVEAVRLALSRAMAEDDSVLILGEDVGVVNSPCWSADRPSQYCGLTTGMRKPTMPLSQNPWVTPTSVSFC